MSKTNKIRYDEESDITYYGDNYRYYKRLFRQFKDENPELVRYGTQWFAYGYQTIEICVPRVGKLIFRDNGYYRGIIEWKERWPDEIAEKKRERELRPEMYQNFLREIRWFMNFYELTQGDIAEMTGMSRKSINKYLSGAVAPKVSTMRKICETLGIDI